MSGIDPPKGSVPLPPPNATTYTTACDYCPVACGYKVYVWPVGTEGGPRASENALGADFPVDALSGKWISPNMHNVVMIDDRAHNVAIIPDPDATAVNIGGTHSIRGGTLALKLYSPNRPTSDRLKWPLLRVRGSLQPISWDAATTIIAEVSKHVINKYGAIAWGVKTQSYVFFESTYAIGKLANVVIGTPNIAQHHSPAWGDDTPGLSVTGIDSFPASFEDHKTADVLFIAGADPYETRTVLFTTWIAPGGAKIIHVDVRKTYTSNFALKGGGQHLQLKNGTDTLLYNSIARVIIENGWEDKEFIADHTASREEIEGDGAWRRRLFGLTFDELKEFLLSDDRYRPEEAERITGVPAGSIRQAAELMAKPKDNGERPKLVIAFEKGVYWTHNFENTGAIANLAVLTGSTGRPGRAITRYGGHQRGGMFPGYNLDKSPDEYQGNKIEMDQDRWTIEGKTRFMWVIGVDWVGASGASQFLASKFRELILRTEPQVTTTDAQVAASQLKARIDNGGMAMVLQDIYLPPDTAEYADLILPAAAWGEHDVTRANAERRLRLYSGFMKPPGEALPDWRIVAMVARKMGFDGFDWRDSNEVFEEAGIETSRGKFRTDYSALVENAMGRGMRAHELLREMGTTGIQLPARVENGQLTGTPRLHSDLNFKTTSKKAMFCKADWDVVEERLQKLKPGPGEFWVSNHRTNSTWQTAFDDMRKPYLIQRTPMNLIEINPSDAADLQINSGDLVSVENDDVIAQTGDRTKGVFTAAAYVTDQVPPGMVSSHFHWPKSPVNSVVPADTRLQPINQRYQFKLGKGRVKKIGETRLKETVPFGPRNIA
ncbi:MAG: arsenate reductase (azurin) large subunit [Nitrososphaerales archaeon]